MSFPAISDEFPKDALYYGRSLEAVLNGARFEYGNVAAQTRIVSANVLQQPLQGRSVSVACKTLTLHLELVGASRRFPSKPQAAAHAGLQVRVEGRNVRD